MAKPFLFFKIPETDTLVQADLTPLLMSGETVSNIVVGTIQPGTTPALTATLQTAITNPQTSILLQGGQDGISYGFNLTVTTNARVFLATVGVCAQDPSFVPYTTQNPQAFQDLIGDIEAGDARIGTAVFSFPAQTIIDPSRGFVTWELLAADGTVYAAGNAFEYNVQNNGISVTAFARSIISIPSTVPPSLDGQSYQLRYTLSLPQPTGLPNDPLGGEQNQVQYFQFENVTIVGLTTVPFGVQPSVELQGVPATVSIVVDKPYDNVTVELWSGNTQIAAPSNIMDFERTANGFCYSGVLDTSQLQVSLIPYSVVWKYWASTNSGIINQDRADMFIINPPIGGAINDMKSKINKARTTLYGQPDLLYPEATCLTWLRRGMDAFNGAYGQFTSFDMTNALGVIREFWLLEAELAAIQSQYLAEGEKAFNFQGAQISLDVDRTQYLDAAAQAIQSRLDNELKLIKTNLIIKGNTGGDGSADPTKLRPGAIGAVGITITPASMFGRYGYGYGIGTIKNF